jgi:cytochrome c oxidase assembly protein subunit 15
MGNTYFPNDNNVENLFKLSAFSDPSLVQFIHRNLAYVIGLFYMMIFFKVYKNKITKQYRSVNILGFFIILQIILGIFTIILGAQIYIAAVHQVSSIFLVTSSIYFFFINTRTS